MHSRLLEYDWLFSHALIWNPSLSIILGVSKYLKMRVFFWGSLEMKHCWNLSSWPSSLLFSLCSSWPHFNGRLTRQEESQSKNDVQGCTWPNSQAPTCPLNTFWCVHLEHPTTSLYTFVLYSFPMLLPIFLGETLSPTCRPSSNLFSPCSQARVAPFPFCYESTSQCRVTVTLWGFDIRLYQVQVLAQTLCSCMALGKSFAMQALISSSM